MRALWIGLCVALIGCAGEEKTPLPYYGEAAPGDGAAGTTAAGGAAGAAGSAGGPALGAVVINEIDPSGDPVDWVELKNRGANAVDVSGWSVAQGYDGVTPPADSDKLVLPAPTMLAPGAYLVVFTRLTNGPGPGDFGIGKDASERVSLFDAAGVFVDDTATDGSIEQPLATGTSWARVPDGDGPFGRATSTKGAANTAK